MSERFVFRTGGTAGEPRGERLLLAGVEGRLRRRGQGVEVGAVARQTEVVPITCS